MKKIHIVYAINPGGGPEPYVANLQRWLEAQGHKVSVLYLSAPPLNNTNNHGVFIGAMRNNFDYYLSKLVGNFRAWPLRLRANEEEGMLLDAVKTIDHKCPVDLIEVFEGMPINRLKKRWKILVRAQGSDWMFRHFCKDGDAQNDHHLAAMERKQLFAASCVSSLSKHLSEQLSLLCSFPLEQIDTTPYPVNEKVFYPASASEVKDSFSLMTVGRLERRKGTHTFLKAMSRVWDIFPTTRVYILGAETEFTQKDLFLMVPYEKRDRLIFPGFVIHDELPNYYRQMTLYVAPTQYETFGYTILEAMACGLPVIASDVGAVPELINEGNNGFLVPYGDAAALAEKIIFLLSDKKRRTEMGKVAREKALGYRLDIIGQLMLNLYLKTIQRGD